MSDDSVNMMDWLNRPAREAKEPVGFPPGDWLFQVTKGPPSDPAAWPKSQAGNPKIQFEVVALQPIAVDPSLLPGVTLPHKWPIPYEFSGTDKSAYRIVQFLTHLGIDQGTEAAPVSILEMLPQANGRLFRGTVAMKAANNPKPGQENRMFSTIVSTAPAN